MHVFSLARARVIAALLLLCVSAVAAAQETALWKIEGPRNNVYLLGSMHVLPPQAKWRSPAIDRAFKEAQVFVFEIDLAASQNPQAVQPLTLKYGLLPQGESLRGVLPKATYAEMERVSSGLGIPAQHLDPMRPWLVALTLSVQGMTQAGYALGSGVDFQSEAWAKANGKKIDALETLDSQLKIFANLPRAQEIEFLSLSLAEEKNLKQSLSDMVAAYIRGDVAALEKLFIAGMNEFPSLRRSMLNERHDKWLPKIEKMIGSGRTHVVVVGIAHLIGPDSVVAMLRARGLKVEGP